MFEFDRSHVEIEQNRARTEAIERLASKCSINCQPAADITSVYSRTMAHTKLMANHLQTECVHKSIIKDRLMLREIWMQQALILISLVCSFVLIHAQWFNNTISPFYQGEYQDAHMLLNYSLESSQVSNQSYR